MRLGQLARKLAVKSADIVSYLKQLNIHIEDGSNSRIEDDHVLIVLAHFNPDLINISTSESGSVEAPVTEPKFEPLPEPMIVTEDSDQVQLQPDVASDTVESPGADPDLQELPDLIKAPKVELKGLKVLGKIELPTPKKKEIVQDEVPAEEGIKLTEPTPIIEDRLKFKEGRKSGREGRSKDSNRTRNTTSTRPKNPVALQREEEAREAERRKKEQIRLEKEKKTQYYLNRVTPSAPVRAAKLINEPQSMLSDEMPDQPKTWWGRFKKWLTSY